MRQEFKIVLLLVYLFVFSVVSTAQKVSSHNTNKITINQMSDKLQKKLLLSEKQQNSVNNILNEYFNEVSKISASPNAHQNQIQLKNKANEKIKSLLDDKQKMKFEIVKDDWWTLVNK